MQKIKKNATRIFVCNLLIILLQLTYFLESNNLSLQISLALENVLVSIDS